MGKPLKAAVFAAFIVFAGAYVVTGGAFVGSTAATGAFLTAGGALTAAGMAAFTFVTTLATGLIQKMILEISLLLVRL